MTELISVLIGLGGIAGLIILWAFLNEYEHDTGDYGPARMDEIPSSRYEDDWYESEQEAYDDITSPGYWG